MSTAEKLFRVGTAVYRERFFHIAMHLVNEAVLSGLRRIVLCSQIDLQARHHPLSVEATDKALRCRDLSPPSMAEPEEPPAQACLRLTNGSPSTFMPDWIWLHLACTAPTIRGTQ